MNYQILSLNCGEPAEMKWENKTIVSSMQRHHVSGPLIVHMDHIEGNKFNAPTLHGMEHSVLYVGDIFQFGEVVAQATNPRIPCGKVNIRMSHPAAKKHFQECGRSGIYFRILTPGKIYMTDSVKLIEEATHKFFISDLYSKIVNEIKLSPAEMQLALDNGAFPKKDSEKWKSHLK